MNGLNAAIAESLRANQHKAEKQGMKLTGGEIVARALKQYGIEYVAGVPGHGIWSLFDAFLQEESKIPFIQVMHEQSAVHIADGYYRASGKPMACATSVGPGATNTIIGLATAYTDSISLFYVSGSPQTYMHGHGTMQEIERQHHQNNGDHFNQQLRQGQIRCRKINES